MSFQIGPDDRRKGHLLPQRRFNHIINGNSATLELSDQEEDAIVAFLRL